MRGEIKSWLLEKIVPDEVFLGATFLVISRHLIVYKRGWIHKLWESNLYSGESLKFLTLKKQLFSCKGEGDLDPSIFSGGGGRGYS